MDNVERVAKAIYERVNGRGCRPWVNIDHKAAYRDQARAAIAAMEGPSEGMVKAGVDFALGVSLSSEYKWPDYVSDLYRVMSAAALKGREG